MGFGRSGITRRSFMQSAGAGAVAAAMMPASRPAGAQEKPAKLQVLAEDFEPLSSFVAKKFTAKHGIEVAFTTVEFTPAYENLWTDELIATDPNLAVIKAAVSVENPWLGDSWPATPNAGHAAIRAQGVLEQSVANAISGRMSPADAVKDAHQKIVDIFEEGGMMQP